MGQLFFRGDMRCGGIGTFRDCIRSEGGELGCWDEVDAGAKRGRPSSSICIEVSSEGGSSREGVSVVIISSSRFSSEVDGGRGISWAL